MVVWSLPGWRPTRPTRAVDRAAPSRFRPRFRLRFPWRWRTVAVGEHWAAVRAGGGRSGDSGTESGMETKLRGSVAGKRPGGAPLWISMGREAASRAGRGVGFWERFSASRLFVAAIRAVPVLLAPVSSGQCLTCERWEGRLWLPSHPHTCLLLCEPPQAGSMRLGWGNGQQCWVMACSSPFLWHGLGEPEAPVCQTLLGFVTALTLFWFCWLCPALPS